MRAIDADAISYESIDSSDIGRHEHYYGTGIIAVRKEDIDEMPTIQPEPHWIPTSERSPKIYENVLLSYFDEVTIGWLNGDGSWSIYDGWKCVSADEISAWLPLLEVYKPSVIEKCLGEKCHE